MRLERASIAFFNDKPYMAFRGDIDFDMIPRKSRVVYIPHRFKHGQALSGMSERDFLAGIDFNRIVKLRSVNLGKEIINSYLGEYFMEVNRKL